jgi:hypothetical protein
MSTASTMLLHLVADLVRADASVPLPSLTGLRDEFNATPETVMSRYGLDHDAAAVVMSMDRQILGEFVRRELLHTELSGWKQAEAPVTDRKKLTLSLVADLVRADAYATTTPAIDNLMTKFAAEPEAVIAAYELDPASRQVLLTKDRAAIGEHIRLELIETPSPPKKDLWAEPLPKVLVPPTTLVAAPNQTLTLQVDCVLADAELHLRSADHLNHVVFPLDLAAPKVRDNVLKLTLNLSGVTPDDYWVLIYNTRTLGPIVGDETIKVVKAP